MSRSTTVKCDHCGQDLTYTSHAALVLSNRSSLMAEMFPAKADIGGPHDFCGIRCLSGWASAREAELRRRIVEGNHA